MPAIRTCARPVDYAVHKRDMRCRNAASCRIAGAQELQFAVFCIENVAAALGKPSGDVYRALSGPGGILHQYIIPSYETLHTQGRQYIVDDICDVMTERGVTV